MCEVHRFLTTCQCAGVLKVEGRVLPRKMAESCLLRLLRSRKRIRMVNEDWKDTNAMSSGVRRKNRTVRSTLKIFQEVRGVVTMVLRRHTNVCRISAPKEAHWWDRRWGTASTLRQAHDIAARAAVGRMNCPEAELLYVRLWPLGSLTYNRRGRARLHRRAVA
jgi:hypothetical protein